MTDLHVCRNNKNIDTTIQYFKDEIIYLVGKLYLKVVYLECISSRYLNDESVWPYLHLYPRGFVFKQENEQLAMLSFVCRSSLNTLVRTNPEPTLLVARCYTVVFSVGRVRVLANTI